MTTSLSARHFYTAMLTGYFGLLALLIVWNTLIHPALKLPVAVIVMIAMALLLLPLRGVLQGRLQSCAWIAYGSLPFLFHGITELASEPSSNGTLFDIFEVLLSTLLLLGGFFYLRTAAKA